MDWESAPGSYPGEAGPLLLRQSSYYEGAAIMKNQDPFRRLKLRLARARTVRYSEGVRRADCNSRFHAQMDACRRIYPRFLTGYYKELQS